MRRGALDRIIDIEHKINTGSTEINETTGNWVTFVDGAFAEVYSVRGAEIYDTVTKQRISEVVTRFRIDYTDAEGINTTMRVKYEGQYYDIKNVLPDHDRKQDCIIDAVLIDGSVSGPTLRVVVEPVTAGAAGQIYQCFFHVFGGTAPYTVSMTGGSPGYQAPNGLSLVQSAEMVWCLEGFPVSAGSYPISVTVSDSSGLSVETEEFVLDVT